MQQILDDMRAYFEAKPSLTPQEQTLLQRLKADSFPVTTVSRTDLQACGFDTRFITDSQMCDLAKKMANDYCEQLFWSSMEIIADGLDFPRHPRCPDCNRRCVRLDEQTATYRCESCGQEWHEDRFVLVEFPEDIHFEEKCIGYPSLEGRDSSARYVPEYDYISHFKIQPAPGKCFKPLRWPESQPYLFPDKPDDAIDSLNEPVMDECGIEDFGENAVWVPLCNLRS